MVKCYRKTITLSDFWVTTHDKLSDFYASAWQRGDSAVPLMVIRLLLASVALGILMWSLCESPSFYWLLYLTNWGMALLTLTLLSGLYVSISAVNQTPKAGQYLNYIIHSFLHYLKANNLKKVYKLLTIDLKINVND